MNQWPQRSKKLTHLCSRKLTPEVRRCLDLL
jgi:hypothetical protein